MNIFFESIDPDLMTIGQLIESLNYKPELEDVTHEFPLGISTYEDFKANRIMNDHKSFNVSELNQHNKDDKAYNSKGEELQFKEFYIKPNTTISEAIKILNKGIN